MVEDQHHFVHQKLTCVLHHRVYDISKMGVGFLCSSKTIQCPVNCANLRKVWKKYPLMHIMEQSVELGQWLQQLRTFWQLNGLGEVILFLCCYSFFFFFFLADIPIYVTLICVLVSKNQGVNLCKWIVFVPCSIKRINLNKMQIQIKKYEQKYDLFIPSHILNESKSIQVKSMLYRLPKK